MAPFIHSHSHETNITCTKLDVNDDYVTLRSSTPMASPWTAEMTLDVLHAMSARELGGGDREENAPRRPARS